MPAPIHGSGATLEPGQKLKVLSWNVQFGAGRGRCFFYDGGPDSRVTRAEVLTTLEGIAALIRDEGPDLVLLQEVDRHSARTADIDQIAWLRERIGLPCWSSTPYFKVPFVPVPPEQPMGRVDMHLVVFSRFSLASGRRIALSPLNEPLYRRLFNLRRAVQALEIPTTDGAPLSLLHTHLSAFSRGDGTLERQVTRLVELADPLPRVLLAGDFNSLPPHVDPNSLGEAAVLYPHHTPILPLLERLHAVHQPPLPTYVPYGSNQADRTIDWAFQRGLTIHEAGVVEAGAAWSDHLPLTFTASL